MKKVLCCTLAFLAFTASSFATPTTDMEGEEINWGISYLNHHINWDATTVIKLPDNTVSDKWNSGFDVILKMGTKKGVNLMEREHGYLFNKNFAVTGGFIYSRIYDNNGDSNVFHVAYGGMIYNQKVTDNITAYVKYVKGSQFHDFKTGSTYVMNDNSYVGWNYRNMKAKGVIVLNGFGIDLGFKF